MLVLVTLPASQPRDKFGSELGRIKEELTKESKVLIEGLLATMEGLECCRYQGGVVSGTVLGRKRSF